MFFLAKGVSSGGLKHERLVMVSISIPLQSLHALL